jgi:hypothetical protein
VQLGKEVHQERPIRNDVSANGTLLYAGNAAALVPMPMQVVTSIEKDASHVAAVFTLRRGNMDINRTVP